MLPLVKNGHYARYSPVKTSYISTTMGTESKEELDESGSNEHILHQTCAGNLSKDWVLLDYQSTLD